MKTPGFRRLLSILVTAVMSQYADLLASKPKNIAFCLLVSQTHASNELPVRFHQREFDQGNTIQQVIRQLKTQRSAIQNHPTSHLLFRLIAPNLHDSLPCSLTHNRTRILPIYDLPNALTRFSQLPHIIARLGLEQPHSAVVTACDEETPVELERSDRRVVCCYSLEGRK